MRLQYRRGYCIHLTILLFFLQRAKNFLKWRLSCILNRQNSLPLSLIDSVNKLSYEKDYILLAFLLHNNFLWRS